MLYDTNHDALNVYVNLYV